MLVRSHECKDEGYEVEADGRLVTVFSAPNYCDQVLVPTGGPLTPLQMGNKAAVIRFSKDLTPHYIQFSAVPHPNVRPMHYASMGGLNFLNFLR